MTKHRESAHRSLPWQILICLAVAAFLLRAAIPNGYMAASAGSSFTLALCHGGQAISITLSLPSKADGHQNGDTVLKHEHCIFSLLAAQAVLPDTGLAPVISAAAVRAAILLPARRALPALTAQGPPLGSRAPPVSLSA